MIHSKAYNEKLNDFLTDKITFSGNAEGCGAYMEAFNIPELKELRELCQFAIVEQLLAQSTTIFSPIFPEGT